MTVFMKVAWLGLGLALAVELGAIQVLRNASGGGGVCDPALRSVTRGWGGGGGGGCWY